MRPREVITEINISTEVFMNNVQEKIVTNNKETWDSLFSIKPHFQWDNIRLKGNKLIIERSIKPLDRTSKYRNVSGTIESEIIADDNKTILKSRITLDTTIFIFLKYTIGLAFGMIGLVWWTLDFNYYVLCGLILFEGFIFGVTPFILNDSLDDLTDYYNSVIRELTKK